MNWWNTKPQISAWWLQMPLCQLGTNNHHARLWLVSQKAYYRTYAYCITAINSLWHSGAIWHHRTGSTLDEVMASPLLGAKPLPKPMLTYYHRHLDTNCKLAAILFKLQSIYEKWGSGVGSCLWVSIERAITPNDTLPSIMIMVWRISALYYFNRNE